MVWPGIRMVACTADGSRKNYSTVAQRSLAADAVAYRPNIAARIDLVGPTAGYVTGYSTHGKQVCYLSKVPCEMMGAGQAKSLGVTLENVTTTEEADGCHASCKGACDS